MHHARKKKKVKTNPESKHEIKRTALNPRVSKIQNMQDVV